MTPEADALIRLRLAQAEHNLGEAEVLLNAGHRFSVMRSIYFTMFYCACAMLESKQLNASRHAGVISLLHRQFVHTGLFPPEVARLLNKAFEERLKVDYKPAQPPSVERLRELLEDARSFLTATKLFLARS